ncbi:efflux transporter outer membrane subunit [Aquisediminimonas sediminicola]|uniref:efflux transporter outer membrane subunit n=1 Tax=Alteraquisediminimonas sediminicola TaxID=2676787 RepID=UPI001FEBEBB4|nr:efflux transporter outer membrane subunit [Aquisediminimonas sediminicola]
MNRPFRIACTLGTMTALSACMMGAYKQPAMPVPAQWPQQVAPIPSPVASTGNVDAALSWQALVRDEKLQALLTTALINNRDLRITVANIGQARAQYRGAQRDRLPNIAAGGSVKIEEPLQGGDSSENWVTSIGITSFEIDLFGRMASLNEAARQRYLASEAGAKAARIALVAELSLAYIQLAADQDLLRESEISLATAERSLQLVQSRKAAGLVSGLDVNQAAGLLASTEADRLAAMTQVAQDRNALDLLVGVPVASDQLPTGLAALDPAIIQPQPDLSSQMLLRRPDVVQAEAALKAGYADVAAARARFFPTISLTSALGSASTALSALFTNGAFSWDVKPSASFPIFGGGGRENFEASKARREGLIASYEKTIQTAFREVADALAGLETIDAQLAAQNRLVTASEQSFTLSDRRYRAGIDSYFTRLDAQRSLTTARKAAIRTRLTQIGYRIALYRAIAPEAH